MELDLEFRKLKKASTIEHFEFRDKFQKRQNDKRTKEQKRAQEHTDTHHDIRAAEVPLRRSVQVHRRRRQRRWQELPADAVHRAQVPNGPRSYHRRRVKNNNHSHLITIRNTDQLHYLFTHFSFHLFILKRNIISK